MTAESGRSMLELLAVMAIAGLLGIGSVEGYQAAVRKNQANNILEGAAQRAISVSQQVALDKDIGNITLGEFPRDAGRGVSFPTSPTKLNEEFFSIPVAGVDEATCKQLQTMAGGALRRVDCNEANGSVTAELIYHKDLSKGAGTAPEGGSSGSSSTHTYDGKQEECVGAGYQYCSDGSCILKGETCPAEEIPIGNCDAYPGTTLEEPQNIEGREYVGLASDAVHWCYCPSGEFYSDYDGCKPVCSSYTASNTCTQAGCYWCQYNSTCRMKECVSPVDINSETECINSGYYWKEGWDCSPTSFCEYWDNCVEYNYYCDQLDNTIRTKSASECSTNILNKNDCENAGYYWYSECLLCLIGDRHKDAPCRK